jgi:hypothetical protein
MIPSVGRRGTSGELPFPGARGLNGVLVHLETVQPGRFNFGFQQRTTAESAILKLHEESLPMDRLNNRFSILVPAIGGNGQRSFFSNRCRIRALREEPFFPLARFAFGHLFDRFVGPVVHPLCIHCATARLSNAS